MPKNVETVFTNDYAFRCPFPTIEFLVDFSDASTLYEQAQWSDQQCLRCDGKWAIFFVVSLVWSVRGRLRRCAKICLVLLVL